MARYGFRARWVVLGLLASVVVVAAGLVWLERAHLLAWYRVRGLVRAGEAERAEWAEGVADLGEVAVPRLVDALTRDDGPACAGAGLGLARLSGRWGAGDGRTADLALRVARAYPTLSAPGKEQVLLVAAGWFEEPQCAEDLPAACARLLGEAEDAQEVPVQQAALRLGEALLKRPDHAGSLNPCRGVIHTGLSSPDKENRLQAIRLALNPGVDLLQEVVPLLEDPAAEVRRAALLAVGPAEAAVLDETLLPRLHDPDAGVRQLAEAALGARGLGPEHIALGRLLTHPDPSQRLRVLDRLPGMPDLDPGLWLRRLSHDPSPAVRAAAVRAMSVQRQVDLSDRIDQMARNDPSPTVSRLAELYRADLRERRGHHRVLEGRH